MARGRPALATVLMTTGVIALAVPGSTAFAGEFLILAGVFQGWGWAVVGAVAIVLAAMYMLRLISAVLHQSPGPAVSPAALDLRPAELGVLVPLVALPARPLGLAGGDHRPARSAGGRRLEGRSTSARSSDPRDPPAATSTGSRSRRRSRCSAPRAIACSRAVLVPRARRRPFAAIVCALGFAGAIVAAAILYAHSADGHGVIADAIRRDRLRRARAIIVAGAGLLAVGVSYGERMRDDHVAEYYALLAAAGAGMVFLVGANNLMTLFLGARVVLDLPLHPLRDRPRARRARSRPASST